MTLRRTEVPGRFVADGDDGTPLATLTLARSAPGDAISVVVEPARGVVASLDDADALVRSVDDLVAVLREPLELATNDELMRDAARRRGWTGALRGPLTRAPGPAAPRPTTLADTITARVGALLPGVQVTRHRSWSHRALTIDLGVAHDQVVRVRLPARDDVMAESVAAAADTLLALRRRFGQRARVTKLDFDAGGAGFAHGSVVGTAEGATGVAVLNPLMIVASELAANRGERQARGLVGVSARLAPPWFPVDAVTAHECWHFMDAAVQTVPARYTEFHRELGAALGVESFELALRGREHGAPDAWREAHDRIVREVSLYATTNAREATAELFVQWWFGTPGASSLVDTFGRLVDRYFPAG